MALILSGGAGGMLEKGQALTFTAMGDWDISALTTKAMTSKTDPAMIYRVKSGDTNIKSYTDNPVGCNMHACGIKNGVATDLGSYTTSGTWTIPVSDYEYIIVHTHGGGAYNVTFSVE